VILAELSKLGIERKCNFSSIDPEIAMEIEETLLKKDVEPLERSRNMETVQVPEVKVMVTQKNNYCPVCNKHIDKYGRRKNDLKMPGWIFCPIHGWFQYKQEKQELEIFEHTNTQLKREDVTKKIKKTANFINNFLIAGFVIIIALFAVLFVINNDFAPSRLVQKGPEMKPYKPQVLLSEPVIQLDTVVPEDSKMIILADETARTKKGTKVETLFTVQIGAFNDLSRAKVLKGKLDKKGYEVYITPSLSKSERLYKVYIGKFSDREKAESNSKKIKQSEGIQTFVAKIAGI